MLYPPWPVPFGGGGFFTILLALIALFLIIRYILYPVFAMEDIGSSIFMWPFVILAVTYFTNGGQ